MARAAAASKPTVRAAPSASGTYAADRGDHHPVPEASPRSVTWDPVSRHVSQSWGSSTVANRAMASGSTAANQASLATVKAATGTEPHRWAHQ